MPKIYAFPEANGPSINRGAVGRVNGKVGQTSIHTFSGETVYQLWKPADSSRSFEFIHNVAKSCSTEIMDRLKTKTAEKERSDPIESDQDMESLFSRCMESQGLNAVQREAVLPSSFRFGVMHRGLGAHYRARKEGVRLLIFKSDVDSCAGPFLNGDQSPVREYQSEPKAIGGQAGLYFGSTYRTIIPGGLALKNCMEQLGYLVEDRNSP